MSESEKPYFLKKVTRVKIFYLSTLNLLKCSKVSISVSILKQDTRRQEEKNIKLIALKTNIITCWVFTWTSMKREEGAEQLSTKCFLYL